MRLLVVTIAAGAVALAFLLGWLTADEPVAPVSPARASGARPPMPFASGEAATAVSDLAAYIADDQPVPPPGGYVGDPPPSAEGAPPPPGEEETVAPLPPPPPPPPPDVALVFRRQVTGVITEANGGLAVLMADAGTGRGTRRLRVGDRYDQIWTLVALSRESALLSDGDRLRRIPFFGGPATSEGGNRG